VNEALSLWYDTEAQIQAQADKLDALREYAQTFFLDAVNTICTEKGWDTPQYVRRPTLGLQIDCDFGMHLAIRPAWELPRGKPGHRQGFGIVITEKLDLEVLGEKSGVFLHVRLREGALPKLRHLTGDDIMRYYAMNALNQKTHDLLVDPMSLFSQQSERCVCCHKTLTDPVSTTRGIGPECIRLFQAFLLTPPSKVEQYRHRCSQEYLAETGFLPGPV
jgi:hypothetical protein